MLGDDPHGAANLAARHVIGPDQVWRAVSDQVNFGFPVAENVGMGWQMVVDVGDDAQAIGPQHGDHRIA